ncbi:helix-turn-helix transcriptional regulator [Roseateles flavus]|uniref:Autoinducer binding domain-containing protein n=1 Tax=Roseateles flavus TaxID=3149041 RepID=A0ABV0GHH1_9BURK
MLHTDHLGVLAAQSESEFRAEIARFAQNLGFRTVDALTVVDHDDGTTEFICVDNIGNPDWNAIDPSYWKRDPVMQHCKTSSIPIAWGAQNYRSQGVMEIYDLVSAYGLRSGLSVSSHMRGGRHFALCVHTDRDLESDTRHVAYALPRLQLFAAHALDTAFRLFLPPDDLALAPLSVQDVGVLSWTLDGKSAEEIATLLCISEDSLKMRLKELAHELQCENEYQAALKALRLGIIC